MTSAGYTIDIRAERDNTRIHYEIIPTDTRDPACHGIATVRIHDNPPSTIAKYLPILKAENGMVAEIEEFYPNGMPRNGCNEVVEQNMRRGVGTLVLERIMEDAEDSGAAALFVETKEDRMKEFLRKKGYSEANIGLEEALFYQIL